MLGQRHSLGAILGLTSVLVGVAGCSDYLSTTGPEHCGAVDSEVWARDISPHDVTCDVTVLGDLTIGMNTRVRFAPGTALIVQGTLNIEGTPERPVRLEAAEPGQDWVGIWVRPSTDEGDSSRPNPESLPSTPSNGNVVIEHAIISGAGARPEGDVPFEPGAVIVDRGPVEFRYSEVESSAGCGVTVGPMGRMASGSVGLTITQSNEGAICTHPMGVSSLPGSEISLPEGGFIDVAPGVFFGIHRWDVAALPLRLNGEVVMSDGQWDVAPGTVMEMGPSARLTLGGRPRSVSYGQKLATATTGPILLEGGLNVGLRGSADAPIVLRSSAEDQAWDRIHVQREAGTAGDVRVVMEHVELDGGGAGVDSEPAMVQVEGDVSVEMRNVTLRGASGAGLLLDAAGLEEGSTNLAFEGNAYPVVAHPDALLTLPTEGSSYTASGGAVSAGDRAVGDRIYVLDSGMSATGVLPNLEVPYRLDRALDVAGGSSAELRIADGVVIEVPPAGEIRFAVNGALGLTIGDSDGNGVIFRGIDGQGRWDSVVFGPGISEGGVYGLTVQDAGRKSAGAAVEFNAADLLVQGLLIDGTGGTESNPTAGLSLSGTMAESSSGLVVRGAIGPAVRASTDAVSGLMTTGIDLSDNGDYSYVQLDGIRARSGGLWRNPGVPYRISKTLVISGDEEGDGTGVPARVRLEAGTSVLFAASAALETDRFHSATGDVVYGSLISEGTESAPVKLLPLSPEVGWLGLRIHDDIGAAESERSALSHLEIHGGGAGGAEGSLEILDAMPTLSDVQLIDGRKYGLVLRGDAFVPARKPLPELSCDRFDGSGLSYENNGIDLIDIDDASIDDQRTGLELCP